MNVDNFPRGWLSRFDLKLFVCNIRDNKLPNAWCFCKTNLDPVIIDADDQQVSFTINHLRNVFGFSVIYASTSYIIRRNLWNKLSNVMNNTPWYFIGDFNIIISVDEYMGNNSPSKAPISDFFNWTDSNMFKIAV